MEPRHHQAVLTQQGRPTDDSRNVGRVLRLVNTIPASQSQKDGTSHTTIAPGAYGDAPASWSYPIGPSGAYYYIRLTRQVLTTMGLLPLHPTRILLVHSGHLPRCLPTQDVPLLSSCYPRYTRTSHPPSF